MAAFTPSSSPIPPPLQLPSAPLSAPLLLPSPQLSERERQRRQLEQAQYIPDATLLGVRLPSPLRALDSVPAYMPLPALPGTAERVIQLVAESCPFKAAFAGVAGMAFGGMIGFAFGGYEVDLVGRGVTSSLKETFRASYQNAVRMGKGFGYVGLLYAFSECAIEKARGRHDLSNSMAAGCATGMFLARKTGTKAMIGGCVGFAAFSAVIDTLMQR